jgi:copper transport protein
MKGMRRASLTSLLALIGSLVWAGRVQAHALLTRSVPAPNSELLQPPASVELWFSEPLEAELSQARLLNSSGRQAATGALVLDPSDETHLTLPLGELQPGIYTVTYRTLSKVDGHEWSGSFPFTVLNPDATRPVGVLAAPATTSRAYLPTPGESVSRWLYLLGGILLLGAPLFLQVAVRADQGSGGQSNRLLTTTARDLTLRAIWVAGLAVTTGQGLQLVLQALRLGGLERLPELLLGTRTGALALARQGLAFAGLSLTLTLPQPSPLRGRARSAFALVMACTVVNGLLLMAAAWRGERVLGLAAIVLAGLGILGLTARTAHHDGKEAERRTWQALLLLAAATLFGISIGSHAGAVPGSLWAILGDYVHLLAAAAWVGGLLLLPMLLWRVRQSPDARGTEPFQPLLLLVRRFSYVASFSVFLLVLTGVFNSLVQLPALPSLWETAYGRVLLVKLGLLALALGVAFFNNRLVHGEMPLRSGAVGLRRLQRQVAVEAGVTLGLMLSVAVLAQTPSPRSLGSGTTAPGPSLPYTGVIKADDLYMHVQVSPNRVGSNRFWLHLFHGDGSPVGEVQLVQLRFNYQGAELGQASVDLAPEGEGVFAVEGTYLSLAGVWDVSVYVRRRGMDDALANFSLEVPMPGAKAGPTTPWQNPVPSLPPILLVVGGLMALGAIPLLWRQPLQGHWPRRYPLFRQAGILLQFVGFGTGFFLLHWFLHRAGPAESSPASTGADRVSPSAASLERGRTLYQQNCLPCHGPVGLGDGPVGLTLNPRPASLQVHMLPGVHSDEQILDWIANGFPGSVMPAFREALTEEQRWHVLNYIRTLVPR